MSAKCETCGGSGCRCAEVTAWDCDDGAERLTHHEIDDAIEDHLDMLSHLRDGKLKVYGYRPMTVPEGFLNAKRLVEDTLEQLDEEFGNWEEGSEPSDAMIEAAKVYHAAILAEYEVWACEQIQEVEIDIADWIAKYRPDWLEAPR